MSLGTTVTSVTGRTYPLHFLAELRSAALMSSATSWGPLDKKSSLAVRGMEWVEFQSVLHILIRQLERVT